MSDQTLDKAITLIRTGQTVPARQVLTQVLKQDPDHEQAWLWISKCFQEPERKQYCFERVLKANPENPIARKALAALEQTVVQQTAGVPAAQRPAAQRPAARQPTAGQLEMTPPKSKTALPDPKRLSSRLERHKYSGALSFLLSLLLVTIIAAGVWAGLNSLLPNHIPLTHAGLKSHLTSIAVFCSSVEATDRATSYAYVMRCNGYPAEGRIQFSVDIYSESDPQKIDLILAYATQLRGQPSASEMGELLAYVAALPYKNANPGQASAWVQRNFSLLLSAAPGEDPVAQFGRVHFHLASLAENRKYLAIGEGRK